MALAEKVAKVSLNIGLGEATQGTVARPAHGDHHVHHRQDFGRKVLGMNGHQQRLSQPAGQRVGDPPKLHREQVMRLVEHDDDAEFMLAGQFLYVSTDARMERGEARVRADPSRASAAAAGLPPRNFTGRCDQTSIRLCAIQPAELDADGAERAGGAELGRSVAVS